MIQSVDNECYGKNLQASFKQSFIREEKNRGEKKNNNNKEKEIIAVAAVDKLPRFSELSETIPRWEQCINEAFITQSWLEAVGMMSGLKELFLNNLSLFVICSRNMSWHKETQEESLPCPKPKLISPTTSAEKGPPVFFWKKS